MAITQSSRIANFKDRGALIKLSIDVQFAQKLKTFLKNIIMLK